MKNISLIKRIFIFILVSLFLFPSISVVASAKTTAKTVKTSTIKSKVITANDLIGRFVIQKQSYNKLWYVSKVDKKRYYIKDDSDLRWVMNNLSQKVTLAELNKIPYNTKIKSKIGITTAKKYYGAIVYTSSSTSTYWYVNPGDSIRYILNSYDDVYAMAKVIGKSVDDATLRKVEMNNKQLTFDAAFPTVAYVRYDGDEFKNGLYDNTILPIASLSKLMTALVLNDQDIDWSKEIIITQEEIDYPATLAEAGSTSEVDLKVGDLVKMSDLWIAMLTASSNQAAVILADHSGLSREEFIEAMNKKATELGLKKTKFYEMSGLNPNNVSTPQEMALIANAAFKIEKISQSTQVSDYTFSVTQADGAIRSVNVKNRNYSLLAMGAEASKTGYLVEAQRNVVLKKNNNIFVVMHALSTTQRNQIIQKLFASSELSYVQ